MRGSKAVACVCLATALAACGGGGGGSSGSGQVSTPATIPSPSPTPSPTPPPTPPAAVIGIGPVLGTVLWDVNGDGVRKDSESGQTTNLLGQFGADIAGYYSLGTYDRTQEKPPIQAVGVDTVTQVGPPLSAPYGAMLVSPISTLIDRVGDQDVVRRFLGLTDAAAAGTDLLRFDPYRKIADPDPAVAQMAARLTAINTRLIILAEMVSPTYAPDPWAPLADAIKGGGVTGLDDPVFLRKVLFLPNDPGLNAEQKDFALALYQRFQTLIPSELRDFDAARSLVQAAVFYLQPTLQRNIAQSSPDELAAIRGYDLETMRGWVRTAATTPKPVLDPSLLYPSPDFRPIWITDTSPIATPLANDFLPGVSGRTATIDRVIVDAENAGKIVVTLTGQNITVAPATRSTKGFAHFDYVVRYLDREARSRVYVYLSGPIV
ncbi:hypothetical protein SAMN03159338_3004 [Sphingomonas sp. NFR04]|uniref:hypothetical protein n=1 Tax=Sphingomonas sp. NFR04 TaxID=1566283 RepID=UPI0008EF7B3E|nr:hypothetical protein [Sphingomonas sp. NFR04]SFK01859.1 hypothetical protein SAMN03159338_3004 [Sphingomonas sp. NFR04]